MKKKSSDEVMSQAKAPFVERLKQPEDPHRKNFNLQVAIGCTISPDPFGMSPTDDIFGGYFYPWDTLESKQHPFSPQHPLAYRGSLNYEWHSFLRGPLNPFIEAFRVLSPMATGFLPRWAIEAASECLKTMKIASPAHRSSSVGWCLGFGISATKKFDEWGVSLKEFGKPSPELKRHLFNEAAERVEHETETVQMFLNGFCDGIKAGREIDKQTHTFKWKLFVALKWAELNGLSRNEVVEQIRQFIKTPSKAKSEERQIHTLLDSVNFPRGKAGRPKKKSSEMSAQ